MTIRKSNALIMGTSLLIGLTISIHSRQGSDSHDIVSLKSVESLREEVNSIEREIERVLETSEKRKDDLGKLKYMSGQEDQVRIDSIRESIDSLKLHSGLLEVVGPGIELRIADNTSDKIVGENVNDDIIHDSDIQIIINDLKRAGAEAISINGQRLISRSEIKCGGPVIKINQRSSANPFIISAIGDPQLLYSAIESQGSYGKMLRDVFKIEVQTRQVEKLKVPAYSIESIDYKYIQMEEEG